MKSSGSSIWHLPNIVKPPETNWLIATLGLMVLGLLVRLPYLQESLWIDELHTAWTISGLSSEIAERAARGNNFPLYFYGVHWLGKLGGYNELVLRMASLGAGLVLIPCAMQIIRHWTDDAAAGWLVGAWAALDNNFIFFSLEARPYACAQLIALLLVAQLPDLMSHPTGPRRTMAIILHGLLFYLHPTNGLLVPATLAARWFGRPRPSTSAATSPPSALPRQLVIDLLVMLLSWLPALPLMLEIYSRRANWATIPALTPPAATFVRWWELVHLPIYVALPVTLLVLSRWWEARVRTEHQRAQHSKMHLATVSCAIWSLWPLTIVWITTRTQIAPLLLLRYIWSSATGPLLLGALLLSQIRSPGLRRVSLVLALLAALSQYGPQTIGPQRTAEPWNLFIAEMRDRDPRHEFLVLIRANLIEASYLTPQGRGGSAELSWTEYNRLPLTTKVYPLKYSADQLIPLSNQIPPDLPPEFPARLSAAPAMWLIARGPAHETHAIASSVESRLRQIHPTWRRSIDNQSGRLRLILWAKP